MAGVGPPVEARLIIRGDVQDTTSAFSEVSTGRWSFTFSPWPHDGTDPHHYVNVEVDWQIKLTQSGRGYARHD